MSVPQIQYGKCKKTTLFQTGETRAMADDNSL